MLEVFEQRNKILLTKYPSHFVEDVLRRIPISETNYNFVKFKINHNNKPDDTPVYEAPKQNIDKNDGSILEQYFFYGYPSGNVLK